MAKLNEIDTKLFGFCHNASIDSCRQTRRCTALLALQEGINYLACTSVWVEILSHSYWFALIPLRNLALVWGLQRATVVVVTWSVGA